MRTLSENPHSSSYTLWPAGACLTGAVLFMLVAAVLYWPTWEMAFVSDNSPVSWLSSAQLWAIAFVAARLGVDRSLTVAAAAWLSVSMVVLACDEQFMLHEHWKYGCIDWWDACRYHWVTEIPIMVIGLVGAATMVWLHYLMRSRAARIVLWCSFGVGVLAIVVDLFGWPHSLVRLEEALEVVAESSAVTFFSCIR
jgi:hypothetical protein